VAWWPDSVAWWPDPAFPRRRSSTSKSWTTLAAPLPLSCHLPSRIRRALAMEVRSGLPAVVLLLHLMGNTGDGGPS
jgi:hypothetical protein